MLIEMAAAAFRPSVRAASPGPTDDFWYRDVSGYVIESGVGMGLSADTIFRAGVVLAAVNWKANVAAVCPPQVMLRTATGRRAAPDHPAQRVLRNPNEGMTGYEWAHLNVVWRSTWGNAYNRIVPGRSYFAEQLIPLHPSRVRVVDQKADGSRVYEYRPARGPAEVLSQSEVHHYFGISLDGTSGAPIYQLIRNCVGIALLAQRHVGTQLRKGTRLAGILAPTTPTTPEQQDDLVTSWNSTFGGGDASGTVGLLPHGVEFKPISMDNQKSMLVDLMNHHIEEALRFLEVPGVAIGYQGDKTATHAAAETFFQDGAIRSCILPLITSMELREGKALLPAGDQHYIKRNLDVLDRANSTKRIAALVASCGGPFLTVNEVREVEDWDPDPNHDADEIRQPLNSPPGGADPDMPATTKPKAPAKPAPDPEDDPAPDAGSVNLSPVAVRVSGSGDPTAIAAAVTEALKASGGELARPPRLGFEAAQVARLEEAERDAETAALRSRARELADALAARVISKEVRAIRGALVRTTRGKTEATILAAGGEPWARWVSEFYEDHAGYVAEVLRIDAGPARQYADEQAAALLAGGVGVVETWETTVTPRLAALALEG